jgi:hypothetical protein
MRNIVQQAQVAMSEAQPSCRRVMSAREEQRASVAAQSAAGHSNRSAERCRRSGDARHVRRDAAAALHQQRRCVVFISTKGRGA